MSVPFRFIHGADLHLDSSFKGLKHVPEKVKADLHASTFAAVKSLTELAISTQAQFIVLSGDLFDEADSSLKAQLFLVQEWKKLEQHHIQVFVIHGNHDHLSGKRAKLQLPSNVHIFGSDEVTMQRAISSQGETLAYIYGISYRTRAVTQNLALQYKRQAEDGYHIALLHGNIGGNTAHDNYAPSKLSDLLQSGMDYWALGHIHIRQVLHEQPYVVYPGNIQGRHKKEQGMKGCYIVDVNEHSETKLQFAALDSVRFVEVQIDVSGTVDEGHLLAKVESAVQQLYEQLDSCSFLVNVKLIGRTSLHSQLLRTEIQSTILSQLQAQDIWESPWIYIYGLEINTATEFDIESRKHEESFIGDLLSYSEQVEMNEQLRKNIIEDAIKPLLKNQVVVKLFRQSLLDNDSQRIKEASHYIVGNLLQMEEDNS